MLKFLFPFFQLIIFIGFSFFLIQCNPKNLNKTTNNSALILLGRNLFYETNLSFNGTKSCASCHSPEFAFTDNYRRSITATGERVMHNAPTLFNVFANHYFDLANPNITTLDSQHQRPLLGKHPVELGFNLNETKILQFLKKDKRYQQLFSNAFGNNLNAVNLISITKAIKEFVASIKTGNSPYEDWKLGKSNALNNEELEGMKLFFSDKFKCVKCHMEPYFTSATSKTIQYVYFNTGLNNFGSIENQPEEHQGIYRYTNNPKDLGKFKAPTLINIAFTAPYFHDGSANNLHEVLDVYRNGGRSNNGNVILGNGIKNPLKDHRIQYTGMTLEEEKKLIAFLYSLSDTISIKNAKYSKPILQPN